MNKIILLFIAIAHVSCKVSVSDVVKKHGENLLLEKVAF